MQVEIFRKKFLKTISSLLIIFIFSTDVALSKDQIFTRIQEYLLDMRTLQANFSQINDTGEIMTGKLYLKKPGKIRFSYDYPHNLQIVSIAILKLLFMSLSISSKNIFLIIKNLKFSGLNFLSF